MRWLLMPQQAAMGPLSILVLMFTIVAAACDSDTPVTPNSIPVAVASSITSSPTQVANSPTIVTNGFPVTIVGADGHMLTIKRPPVRIVSHSPGVTEILFAIGAGKQVVAADEFSDYPPAVIHLERVSYTNPDPERVLALMPDLVIFAEQQQQQIEQFRRLGMPVLFAREPKTIDGVCDSIVMLGHVTGHEPAAQTLVSDMQRRIDIVVARVADVERSPTVFYELTDDLYTAGPETFIGGMLRLLHAENIASGTTSPFPQLTAEAVLAANPQVVLLADGEWVSIESVVQRPGWESIAAVMNGRVHPINPDLGNRPGPRIVDAIEEMARVIYPEHFPER